MFPHSGELLRWYEACFRSREQCYCAHIPFPVASPQRCFARSFPSSWREIQNHLAAGHRSAQVLQAAQEQWMQAGQSRDEDGLPPLCQCPLTEAQELLVPRVLSCTRAAGICSKQFKNNIPNQGKCCSLADFSKCFEICFREGRKRAVLRAKFP